MAWGETFGVLREIMNFKCDTQYSDFLFQKKLFMSIRLQIPAASLSGDCSLVNESFRLHIGLKQHHQL